MNKTALVGLAFLLACGPAGPEPVEGAGEFSALQTMSQNGVYHVELTPSVDHIHAADPFDIIVQVHMPDQGATPADLTLFVDAFMPLDGHGFLGDDPAISGGTDGVFDVTGVHLNHGNEVWELYFDLTSAGVTERATFEVIPDGTEGEHDHEH